VEFEEFVDGEFAALGRFAGALTGDRHLAEDLLAEALLKVSVRWHRVSRADSPAAYTRRVITRTYLSHQRRSVTRRESTSADGRLPEVAVADPADGVVARDEIRRLLERLSPQQRAAVVLRYQLDLPDAQIAAELGCSPATVRSHLSHARQVLRLAADEEPAMHEGNAT
jgi:RNA polymerase sigma-70 factor (sigma-E family)